MRRMISILTVAVLLYAVPAMAQVPQLQQGVQYKVAFTPTASTVPTGANYTYENRVYFDGALYTGTMPLVNGEYQIPLPMWAAGVHNIRVSAIPKMLSGTLTTCQNASGATIPCETFATPDPFQVSVVATPPPPPPVVAPLAPGQIRIIMPVTVGQGGTLTFGTPVAERIDQAVPSKEEAARAANPKTSAPKAKAPAKKKGA